MKKITLILIMMICISHFVHAQWATSGSNIYNTNSGNVGIGTSGPTERLTVTDPTLAYDATTGIIKLKFDSGNGGGGLGFEKETFNTGGLRFYTQYGWGTMVEKMRISSMGNLGIGTTAPTAKLHILNTYDLNNGTGLKLFYQGSWGTPDYASNFRFVDIASTEGSKILQVNGYGMGVGCDPPAYLSPDKLYINGNVGIGTTDPKGYKLAVNGSAIATSMTVKLYANWPDYVFKKDYQLRPLTEVKTYINQNQHLPEMPSEEQIIKEGLNLGEMNKLLTKKVEELTLYLIEKDKEMKDLRESEDAEARRINKQLKEQQLLLDKLTQKVDYLTTDVKQGK
jgi:hypothetical protein